MDSMISTMLLSTVCDLYIVVSQHVDREINCVIVVCHLYILVFVSKRADRLALFANDVTSSRPINVVRLAVCPTRQITVRWRLKVYI